MIPLSHASARRRRLFLCTASSLVTARIVPAAVAEDEVRLAGRTTAAADIWTTFKTWLVAYEAGDLEGIMRIFDPAVIFSFQGSRDQALGDLRETYVEDLRTRAPGARWVPRVDEVYAEDTLGFVRAIWELHVQRDGATRVDERNRSMDVFRQRDGQWRIIRSINYPEKP